jgi:hypothetical protein
MNEPMLLTATRNGAKRMPVGLVVALAMTLLRQDVMANPDVNLGAANHFSSLAGSAITFTGPNRISGDIGSYPTTSTADQSITLDTDGTVLDVRLLAENGAVTLDDNTITAPSAEKITGGVGSVTDNGSTLLLLGSGLAALVAVRHSKKIR